MAISDIITSMRGHIGDAYTALADKKATIPEQKNLANLKATIDTITTGGGGGSSYTRPSDWLTIPETDGSVDEVYILNGVGLNCLNQISFALACNSGKSVTIDWGDGSTPTSVTQTSSTTFSHYYDYTAIPESSWTTHNRTKQVLVHIYGARGSLNTVNFQVYYSYTNSDGKTVSYNSNISTDIYEIEGNVERLTGRFGVGKSSISMYNLEIFDWKGTLDTSLTYLFDSCYSLQSIPQLDTSSVTDTSYMFQGCYSLQSIPQLDTSSVTNMRQMFASCYSLQSIPQLDTSSVTNMYQMFASCYSLQSIPQLDTSSVTDMHQMFASCSSLQSIPQLDTSSVTDMYLMFASCSSLQSIPQLDTSSVTDMSQMFYNCYPLRTPRCFNAGNKCSTFSSFSYSTMMSTANLIDLFNSITLNTSGSTKTLQIGSTLQGYLSSTYVKDSGELYTAILPTADDTPTSGKSYYTYNEKTGDYTAYTGTTFEEGTIYYEQKTATWNRYDKCESTDDGAMLALNFVKNIKKWTVS